jgi:hypothetical protein
VHYGARPQLRGAGQGLHQRHACCQLLQLWRQPLLQEGWGAGRLQEAGGDAIQSKRALQGGGGSAAYGREVNTIVARGMQSSRLTAGNVMLAFLQTVAM